MLHNCMNRDIRFTSPANRLEISAVQPEDEGLYVCQVSVNGGDAMPRFAGCIVVYGKLRVHCHGFHNLFRFRYLIVFNMN